MKVETTYSHTITSFFGPFYLLKDDKIHVFIIGVILTYIGYMKDETPEWTFRILYVLSGLMFLLIRFKDVDLKNKRDIIKITHFLVILPFVLYVAYTKKLSSVMYNVLFGLGIFVILYHAYKAFTRYNIEKKYNQENFNGSCGEL